MIQVYTGTGKGKTTAAFGLAMRAVGHGKRVLVIQFMKNRMCGEHIAAERLAPELEVERMGPAVTNEVYTEQTSALWVEPEKPALAVARMTERKLRCVGSVTGKTHPQSRPQTRYHGCSSHIGKKLANCSG